MGVWPLASTITVGQRIWLVRSQALAKRVPE